MTDGADKSRIRVTIPEKLGGGEGTIPRDTLPEAMKRGFIPLEPFDPGDPRGRLGGESYRNSLGFLGVSDRALGNFGSNVVRGLGDAFFLGSTVNDYLGSVVAPFGVSKAGLKESFDKTPIASGVGRGVGIVGGIGAQAASLGGAGVGANVSVRGAGALGRLGQAAKLATIPGATGAAARVAGSAAEAALAKAIGQQAAKAGAKAVAPAVALFTEGAILGTSTAMSDANLEDKDLTAEELLTNAGLHGITNLALGGAFTLGGKAVASGTSRIGKALIPSKFKGPGSGSTQDMLKAWQNDAVVQGIGKGGKAIKGATDDQIQRAGLLAKANKIKGSPDTVLGKANALNERLLAEFDDINALMDTAFDAEQLVLGELGKVSSTRFRKEAIFPLGDDVVRALDDISGSLPEGTLRNVISTEAKTIGSTPGPIPFSKLRDVRKTITEKLGFSDAPNRAAVAKLSARVGERLNQLSDDAAVKFMAKQGKHMPGLKGLDYGAKRATLSDSILLKRVAEDGVSKGTTNQFTQNMANAAGIFAMGQFGIPTGLAGVLLARPIINKMSKEAVKNAPFAAASTANTVGKFANMMRGANSTKSAVDGAIGELIKPGRLVREVARPQVVSFFTAPEGLPLEELARQQSEQALAAAAAPNQLTQGLTEQLAPVAAVLPETALAMQATSLRAVDYLAQNAIKAPPQFGVRPDLTKWRPSKGQASSYMRRVRAAADPISVFASLAGGNVSIEEIETLKQVYPRMYARAQQEALILAANLKEQLPYEKRLLLSKMFGIPMDAAVANLGKLQQQYQQPQQDQEAQARGTPKFAPSRAGRLKLSDNAASEAQRLEAR